MRFGQGSAAARRLLISSLLALAGCAATDSVNRSAYEPNIPAPGVDEFERSSRLLFKRVVIAFGEDRWDGVVSDAKRLQMIGHKWDEQKPTDPARLAEHHQAAQRLENGAKTLEQAALKADAAAVSKALGEVAEALSRLHFTDVHPAPPAAAPATKG